MDNIMLIILLIAVGLLLAIIVGLSLKLRQLSWTLNTKLNDIDRAFGQIRKQLGALSTSIESSANETQNAVYLSQLDLTMPVFMGGWSIDTFLGKFLVQHVVESRPKTILELGSGSSTVLIARALEIVGIHDCTHIAVDHEPKYLGISREYARLNGLEDRVTWLECPLRHYDEFDKLWYGGLLDRLEGKKIDLLAIDGPPGPIQRHSRYPALPLLKRFLAEHCTVILDDAGRDEEQEIVQRWGNENPEFKVDLWPNGHGIAMLTR